MSKIEVSRGNCPCLVKDPRELASGPDGYVCSEAMCSSVDHTLGAMPEPAAPQQPIPSPEKVRVALSRILPLFGGAFGEHFLLVIPEHIRPYLALTVDVPVELDELRWTGPESRARLFDVVRQWQAEGRRGSVLWIADDEFEHLPPDLMEHIKLGAISYFSTGFSTASLQRYFDIITETDYEAELDLEQGLIGLLEDSSRLVLRTPSLGATAVFEHQESLHWFSLHGPLRFGDQTVLPTGEISSLADASGDYDAGTRLSVNGDIVFQGSPIIHRGDRQVPLEHTWETYHRLSDMEGTPVVAHVRNGYIEEFTAPVPESRRLREAFLGLVDSEPRYRKIHEFGFGTHQGCAERLPTNFHPNERWPGIHLGLGLGGYTPFHIDLALTEVDVLLDSPSAGLSSLYRTLGYARS